MIDSGEGANEEIRVVLNETESVTGGTVSL
jgi:hypothetical protein